jgi:protein-ribulosamine 3-kinase
MKNLSLPPDLSAYLQSKYNITDAVIVKGGSINEAAKIYSKTGTYFIKWNEFFIPDFFESEVKNLQLIKQQQVFSTPEIVEVGYTEDTAFLMLDYIESSRPSYTSMRQFGEKLAQFHSIKQAHFGLNFNNYCGLIFQTNVVTKNWTDFFVEYRLRPLVNRAFNQQLLYLSEVEIFVKLFEKFSDYFPKENPALLHGDLWSGNFITTQNQDVTLIDPACYFGHRELDLAMTSLFGGFDRTFYEAYEANYPLVAGWKDRVALWNIYPLLIHLILFGDGYRPQLVHNLSRIAA